MTPAAYNANEMRTAFAEGNYAFVLKEALPHAVSGNAAAQCMISLLHQCGLGVPRDLARAEEWLLKAAVQDDPVAWNNLGTLYAMGGHGLSHGPERAQKCWRRAKELGFDCAAPYPPAEEQK